MATALFGAEAKALKPQKHNISQRPQVSLALQPYLAQNWTTEHGLPSNTIQTVLQGPEGYLWLGTQGGLVRFDGVRFTVFDKVHSPALGANSIIQLLADRRGRLWIGTLGGGLSVMEGHAIRAIRDGLQGTEDIRSLAEDADGSIWLTTGKMVFRQMGSSFLRCPIPKSQTPGQLLFHPKEGLLLILDGWPHRWRGEVWQAMEGRRSAHFSILRPSPRGEIFASGSDGLYQWTGAGFEKSSQGTWKGLQPQRSFLPREDGLWIAPFEGGLYRCKGDQVDRPVVSEGLQRSLIGDLARDREGGIWVGTYGEGLFRLKARRFQVLTQRDGLSHDFIFSLHEDRLGRMWAGTFGGGLNCFLHGQWRRIGEADLPKVIRCILEDRSGRLWIGSYGGGLSCLEAGRWKHFGLREGLPGLSVYALLEDRQGQLWIGTDKGLVRWTGRDFRPCSQAHEIPQEAVRDLLEDRKGRLWIGMDDRLVEKQGESFRTYTRQDGLSDAYVRGLDEDEEGRIWVSTPGAGVTIWDGGRFRILNSQHGLPDNFIYQVIDDRRGHLWMSSNHGLIRIDKQELGRFLSGRIQKITPQVYGLADGLEATEGIGGNEPAACRSRDGRLWIPTIRGAVILDPALVIANTLPPPVRIESLLADGQLRSQGESVVLAPGTGNIEIQYTAMSFPAPSKVMFRTRMEDIEPQWVEAGIHRSVNYARLPPGNHLFRVMACNDDGVWNTQGASLSIRVLPHGYQTWWFQGLVSLSLAGLAYGAHRFRSRQIRKRAQELQALVEEKTLQLREANRLLSTQLDDEKRVRIEVLDHLEERQINLLKECPQCGACFESHEEACSEDGQALTHTLPVDRTIAGKYRLEQLLGRGGMGAVYRAQDLGLGRKVALKVMLGRMFGDPLALRRFEREARLAASLRHPNIVEVFDFGSLSGGGAFLVMEYLEGCSLAERIAEPEPIPPADLAEWMEQAVLAVEAAHAAHILHRDLKPANLFLVKHPAPGGDVKLLDLGLAKQWHGNAAESRLTASGVTLGTLAYMAPEQLKGQMADERADIYALGIVLIEALTGEIPFETPAEIVMAPYHLPILGRSWLKVDQWLQKCIAKDPEQRFQSAQQIREKLLPHLRSCEAWPRPWAGVRRALEDQSTLDGRDRSS